MIQKLLNSQTKRTSSASLILMGSYLLSALLGLFRDRLLAGKFGAGNELDAYYAAFVIPDLIALILVFGAISVAVIPIFNSYFVKSKDEAWHYLAAFFNVFLGLLIIICFALAILAPYFVSLITPGFSAEKRETTVALMRIMFLSPIILGASNIIAGILQVFHRFLVTALAPVAYNLGIIFGILFLAPKFGLVGLSMGVILGAILHLLIQVPSFLNSGFKLKLLAAHYKPQTIFHPGVKRTLITMAPRSLGLGAGQVNTIIVTAIASTLAAGSIAVFNLANNLASILVNAVSVSLSTAIFPTMTLAYLKEDKREFELKFSRAFRQILFLAVPLSFLVFILRAQIIRVILGWGKFGWLDTRLTAACLGIFAFSLFAQGLVFIISKTFYAAHNTKIPSIISVVSVVFNILLALALVWFLSAKGIFYVFMGDILKLHGIENISIIGLVLAYSTTAILQVILLLFFLYKKFRTFNLKEIVSSFCKTLTASFAAGIAAFLIRQGLVAFEISELQTFFGVFLQLVLSGIVGAACYIAASFLLKSDELKTIKESIFQK